MKIKKWKSLKLTVVISCLALLLFNCNYDDELENAQGHNHGKIHFEKKSFSELIKTKTFKKCIDKIPKKKVQVTTALGKTIMEEQYGFTIIDAPVNITETENTIAYNILIKTDSLTPGNFFENLVVNVNKATYDIKAFKIKYNLLATIEANSHDSFNLKAVREIENIIYNANQIESSKIDPTCVRVTYLMCSYQESGSAGNDHVAGNKCINESLLYYTTTEFCSTGGGGGGSGFGGGDSGSGSGSGSGSTGNTSGGSGSGGSSDSGDSIIDLFDNPAPPCPTCPEFEDDTIKTPCDKLSFLNYQVFTDVIYDLEDEYNSTDESSYTFFNTFNPANQIGTTQKVGFRGGTEFVLSSRTFGSAHIHNNVVEPMFSFSDLLAPCAFANQYQEPTVEIPFDDLFFNMMVINGFTYIIFPNDPMTFKNELNYIQENRLNFDIELGMIYKKLTKNNAVQSDYEKTFLEFIESIGNSNLNISMYVIENNASSFQNRGWQKVDLDSTSPNGIKKTNCN